MTEPAFVPGLTRASLEWQDFAACAEVGTEMFFPDKGPVPFAKQICDVCPVQQECLDYALDYERTGWAPHGVFGGLTATEREAILIAERRDQREAA